MSVDLSWTCFLVGPGNLSVRCIPCQLRPPKIVSCVLSGITNGNSVGRIFFFFNLELLLTLIYRRYGAKQNCVEIMNINFQSALLDPLGRSTGNTFLFKGGLREVQVITLQLDTATSPLLSLGLDVKRNLTF